MNAKRRTVTPDTLPGRVYPKHGAWYWAPMIDGKVKWIKLCRIIDGDAKMLERLAEEKRKGERTSGPAGNVPVLIKQFIAVHKPTLSPTWHKTWDLQGRGVATYFREWNVDQIDVAAVNDFVKGNWPDKITTQRAYRSWLSSFMSWCVLNRHAKYNPCKDVPLSRPKARKVYITDAHFIAIREALMIGDDGKRTNTGPMMQCFIDLCYLTLQRSTDIRELKWADIDGDVIHFVPSKTEDSSGEAVDCPITPEIRAVLDRAKKLQPICEYVIRDTDGKPKTQAAVRHAWNGAMRRAGLDRAIYKYTVKDIRAKAVTDGEKQGFSKEDLRIAAAHTSTESTEIYLKDKQTPVSKVMLKMPKTK